MGTVRPSLWNPISRNWCSYIDRQQRCQWQKIDTYLKIRGLIATLPISACWLPLNFCFLKSKLCFKQKKLDAIYIFTFVLVYMTGRRIIKPNPCLMTQTVRVHLAWLNKWSDGTDRAMNHLNRWPSLSSYLPVNFFCPIPIKLCRMVGAASSTLRARLILLH